MSIPLEDWVKQNAIRDEMVYKNGALAQFEDLVQFAEELGGVPCVVSTHRSKSIDLPVIEVTTDYGVRCIVRDNFHDIKVSVWCPSPCDHDLFGLPAGGGNYLHSVYFEGFKKEWVHDPFVLGAKEFSVCLGYSTLLAFATALRWKFEPVPEDHGPKHEWPWRPKSDYFNIERVARNIATQAMFPVLYHRQTVFVLYRFFKQDLRVEPVISPNVELLRRAFTRQAPGYDGKVKNEPIPYLNLDFTSGCPEPVDEWLLTLNTLVKERREDKLVKRLGDDIGACVLVNRMDPELRSRAKSLGCTYLLRVIKDR